MIPKPNVGGAELVPDQGIAQLSSRLSRDIVDVAGFLDVVDTQANRQLELLAHARNGARRMTEANEQVAHSADESGRETARILQTAEASLETLRAAGRRTRTVAEWVEQLDARMTQLEDRINRVSRNNEDILSIAQQVEMLAINAKIEAARAGDFGRGFAVVAEAINALSRKTSTAATDITTNMSDLSESLRNLKGEAVEISRDAATVRVESEAADAALSEIATGLSAAEAGARDIAGHSNAVREASEAFGPAFNQMSTDLQSTVENIAQCRGWVNDLIESSEALVQRSVAAGGATEDSAFIDRACLTAGKLGELLDAAVDRGEITMDALFDRTYQPIPNTNPEQHMARFTKLTDRLFTPVQEEVLAANDNIAFCAAVDRNGYLPTHNLKFSRAPSDDPVWNAAHCRNRRIFNDRVGLKAGRNTQPFLVQVYRRDMGGGNFVLMKDVSAPIKVKGRHWGGLRLAYAID